MHYELRWPQGTCSRWYVDLGSIQLFGAGDGPFRCRLARRPMGGERIRQPGSSLLGCEDWDRPVDIERSQEAFRSVIPGRSGTLKPFWD